LKLEEIGAELGISELEGWYKVSRHKVCKKAPFLSTQYNNNLFIALQVLYPDYPWNSSRFSIPLKRDQSVQKKILEDAGRELGVKELDDWYSVSRTEVLRKIPFIITSYNNSLLSTLKAIYPHHSWDSSRFQTLLHGHWNDLNHQRNKLEEIGKQFGVKELDDWYKVPRRDVLKKISFLSSHYNSKLLTALKVLYPNHPWDPSLFSRTPVGHWNDLNNQKRKLEEVGKKLGVKELEDWYFVSRKKVRETIPFIFKRHENNFLTVLQKLYPQHSWNPIHCRNIPRHIWENSSPLFFKEMLSQLIEKYKIKDLREWYNIPDKELRVFHQIARRLFSTQRKMLEEWFPKWREQMSSSKSEIALKVPFIQLFNVIICTEYVEGSYSHRRTCRD
jgi:hypothetical protein